MRAFRALRNSWACLSGRRRLATREDIRAWTVGNLLLELPRCTRRVRLLSPQQGPSGGGCEWIVSARDLEHWLEERDPPVVAARPDGTRRAFRLWLQAADDRVDAITDLPDAFRSELRGRFTQMVSAIAGELRCVRCDDVVTGLEEVCGDKTLDGAFTVWTTQTRCVRGHDLFSEAHATEFYFGGRASRHSASPSSRRQQARA